MFEPLIFTFVLVFISEIADKSQLVILGLALKYKSPFKIFLIGLSAQVLMDMLAILAGSFFSFYLPYNLMRILIAVLFILFGIWTFAQPYFSRAKKNIKKLPPKFTIASLFLTVFLSELGDKTQITAGLLTAKYKSPILILVGLVSALAVVIAIYVLIGTKLAEKIPSKLASKITSILLILFGLLSLLS